MRKIRLKSLSSVKQCSSPWQMSFCSPEVIDVQESEHKVRNNHLTGCDLWLWNLGINRMIVKRDLIDGKERSSGGYMDLSMKIGTMQKPITPTNVRRVGSGVTKVKAGTPVHKIRLAKINRRGPGPCRTIVPRGRQVIVLSWYVMLVKHQLLLEDMYCWQSPNQV